MHWRRLTNSKIDGQNEVKLVPSFCILSSSKLSQTFIFGPNRVAWEHGMPMTMLVKWQSKLLLFWKLFLKIQMNSKFDETWSIVFTMKSTSTHLKESNLATTWIWMIKCLKEVNLLLSLQGLTKIYREPKTTVDSIFKPLFDLVQTEA